MSADRQRLKNAIRAIALTHEERRKLLGEGQNRGGKASSAGVGTSEAEESRLCCDGSTSSNANPGTSERDPDASSQDGLDSDDPAKLDNGDGTLSGVTDCATGEPVCFDGSGFIPPEGWEAPSDPPVEESYDPDYWWRYYSVDGFELVTNSCIEAWAAFSQDVETGCGLTGPDPSEKCAIPVTNDGHSCGGIFNIRRMSCSGSFDEVCNEPPPTEEAWPSDGCTNLIVKDGKIVGSKYDPENDGSYSAPRESIDLCSSGDQISLAPAANGGWKTINSTTNNGYLYDSSGKQIAHIDGNQYSDPTV